MYYGRNDWFTRSSWDTEESWVQVPALLTMCNLTLGKSLWVVLTWSSAAHSAVLEANIKLTSVRLFTGLLGHLHSHLDSRGWGSTPYRLSLSYFPQEDCSSWANLLCRQRMLKCAYEIPDRQCPYCAQTLSEIKNNYIPQHRAIEDKSPNVDETFYLNTRQIRYINLNKSKHICLKILWGRM